LSFFGFWFFLSFSFHFFPFLPIHIMALFSLLKVSFSSLYF
jgi:hypothetical protein